MPFRWSLFLQAQQLRHASPLNSDPSLSLPIQACFKFHSSAIKTAQKTTHYDTLNLPPNATAAEIKRRYYELSKTHHPDRNPKDPGAAGRFAHISDAYAVIGNVLKREKYDRDIARTHGVRHQRPGPAGGRPASGLSRRRTQVHGPPPSFFKNAGWGDTGNTAHTNQSGTIGIGGFGVGGTQSGRNDDVPHFDFERHRAQQERRRRPMPQLQREFDFATSGIIVPLLGVASLIIVAIAVASQDSRSVETRKHSNDKTE